MATKFGQRVAQETVLRDGSKLVNEQQAEIRMSLFFDRNRNAVSPTALHETQF